MQPKIQKIFCNVISPKNYQNNCLQNWNWSVRVNSMDILRSDFERNTMNWRILTLSDLKTLLSFQFVFCETWQFNSRHLRIKDEILSYPFLFLASSIFFAVSTLKYLTLAFCHSLDCCCCLQSDDGSEGHRGQTPPKKEFGQTSSPYFNLTGWSLCMYVCF